MSKIIETLKAKSRELTSNGGEVKEFRTEKSGYELTQEQLADIYFSATGKTKAPEAPIIIKVVEKPRLASVAPWLITSVAFLITALSLFSTKRIFVDIKVVDDKTPYDRSAVYAPPPAVVPVEAKKEVSEKVRSNPLSSQEFVFEGAAYLKSSRTKGGLTLVNSSVAPFARATLYFDPPINLAKSKVIFYARGEKGGENIAFALKDNDNIQAFHKGVAYPFAQGLTTDWQKAEVSITGAARDFDPRNVASLRFEFGSKNTENKSGDTVYVKDLQWVSES